MQSGCCVGGRTQGPAQVQGRRHLSEMVNGQEGPGPHSSPAGRTAGAAVERRVGTGIAFSSLLQTRKPPCLFQLVEKLASPSPAPTPTLFSCSFVCC